MKKLLCLSVVAAVLAPSLAGAVLFTNMSGTGGMDVFTASFTNATSNTIIRQRTRFSGASERGILTIIPGQLRTLFFEDHMTFTGANNDAELIVQGNVLLLTRNLVRGPAMFSMNSPAAIPSSGKVTRLEITGAARVEAAKNAIGTEGALLMTLQPSSVVFNVYSSGSFVRTEKTGNAAVSVPILSKTFSNLSSTTLPSGFTSKTSI